MGSAADGVSGQLSMVGVSELLLQCFVAVGWTTGMTSGLQRNPRSSRFSFGTTHTHIRFTALFLGPPG